jgi:excisionase family DNA binding protein
MDYLVLTSPSQVYDLMKQRGLPYLRCGGRYRFDVREVDAWLRGTTMLDMARARKAK